MSSTSGLNQKFLSSQQRTNGIQSDKGIPGEPIAVIDRSPEELSRSAGLTFEETFDGLDYLQIAVLELPSGTQVALSRHRNAPKPGTTVSVLARDAEDSELLPNVLDALGLSQESLLWVRPKFGPDTQTVTAPTWESTFQRLTQVFRRRRPLAIDSAVFSLIDTWLGSRGWEPERTTSWSLFDIRARKADAQLLVAVEPDLNEQLLRFFVDQSRLLHELEPPQHAEIDVRYLFVFTRPVRDREKLRELATAAPLAEFYTFSAGEFIPLAQASVVR